VAGRAEDIRLTAWWSFMAAHAQLVQRADHDLEAATALPLASYNVLRLLHEAPDFRLRLGELARAVFLTRSGATRLANRLEKAGFLCREEDAVDRRGSSAVLTDRGRNEWRRARAMFARTIAKHFGSRLSDAEAETLNVVLSRIVAAEAGADFQ
jgi:DNA-binding MarR family transcriptional regulator